MAKAAAVVDPVVRWDASDSAGVTSYSVGWSRNGAAAGAPVSVPQSSAGDSGGYSSDWNSANPGVTLTAGDVLIASVAAINATTGLSSAPAPSNSLTIPTAPTPPDPPSSVVLSIS
jgi:hypothetical protein